MFSQISVKKVTFIQMHFQRESSEMDKVPKYAFDVTIYADVR